MAALYGLSALSAMWLHAPRVPYADGWRYIAVLADAPFLDGVLMVSNGHREVFPNIVRWLDLRLFGASQLLQILVGIALLLGTLAVLWRPLGRLAPLTRVAAYLWAIVGLCWLGNARALAHAQESVHAYLVTLALVCGVTLLARAPHDGRDAWRRGLLASACGLVATFSFGSGVACFGAFLIVLWLRRASWRDALPILFSAGLAAVSLAIAGVGDERIGFAPLVQGERLLRWLAAPSLYAAWPVLDPEIAARLPLAPLRAVVLPVAEGISNVTGPAHVARWPHLLTGVLGAAWLLVASIRCRCAPTAPVVVGLGVAWFAVGVGGLIALARLGYFELYPEQLLASRYVVWSSLFWAGLAYATISRARSATVSGVAIVLALVLMPSQLWMWRYAERLQEVALPVATAVAVGVLDPALPLGENVVGELRDASKPLEARGAAMYAWPETSWLGRRPDADAVHAIATGALTVSSFEDQLSPGEAARRVEFATPSTRTERWLLQDEDGVVRGLATRDPLDARRAIGWMRGPAEAPPRVLALREVDGS
ncbi:hypothetical protein V3391_10850 [Luteimonas sp. SMYT11W]|uniref:Transmembrane protein n=1 Tax=Luteimonas flava TaxID=3115822 RepID=A0ABU7WHS5_9GAMM